MFNKPHIIEVASDGSDSHSNFKIHCSQCNQDFVLRIEDKGFQDWIRGAHIQDALASLDSNQRELLISGTCGKCFDAMFGDQ